MATHAHDRDVTINGAPVLVRKDAEEARQLSAHPVFPDADEVAVIPPEMTPAMQEHKEMYKSKLEDAGFDFVRIRALTDQCLMFSTGRLPEDRQEEFASWAEGQKGFERLEDDLRGQVWRLNI